MAYVGNRQSNSIQTNPQLRWYMFSKFQYEISNLQHILLSLRNTSASTLQNLPSPLNYGWKSSDESYLLILADELPASLALIELSLCSCKTKCATYRCICRKDALQCMDMCKCGDCENDDAHDASDNELKYLITEDKEHA